MRILKPQNGTHVKKRTITVRGMAKDQKPVQVYVLANDGLWYLQPEVTWNVNHRRFSVQVWLGEPSAPPPMWPPIDPIDGMGVVPPRRKNRYRIVAVKTASRPETPLSVLPRCPKSRAVRVFVDAGW